MNLLTTLILFVSSFCITDSDEVLIKSILSSDKTKVYLKISLPSEASVSFLLEDTSGTALHQWEAQELSKGRHELALPMPLIDDGDYSLAIKVDEALYHQLIYVRG